MIRESGCGFSKIEFVVISLVVIILGVVVCPKVVDIARDVKLKGAINSAYKYTDSVSKFYVSQLMIDTSFNLDGKYIVSDGSLVDGDNTYDVLLTGSVPSTGYLNYENNKLKDGCIIVNGYSITVNDGVMESAVNNDCSIVSDDVNIALGM